MARILVVDDDEQIRIMLHIVLSRDSHEVWPLVSDRYLKLARTMGAHFIFDKPLSIVQLRGGRRSSRCARPGP